MTGKLLLVDGDNALLPLLQWGLEQRGFVVDTATNGHDALAKAVSDSPDLIVLELMLPGIHGLDVCRAVREDERLQKLPLIILTARHEPFFQAAAEDLGVTDYLTKPFDLDHLLARIRLRLASGTEGEDVVECGALHLVRARYELEYLERAVAVVPHEFTLLEHLLQHPHQLQTHATLVRQVWGPHPDVTHNSLVVLVKHVRHKLRSLEYPGRLRVVRGEGYAFEPAPPPDGSRPAVEAGPADASQGAVSANADVVSVAPKQEPESQAGSLRMDPRNRGAILHGRSLPLTRREYALLERLSAEPGRLVSRATIARDVWQSTCEPNANVIDVYVGRLRRKLRAAGYTGDVRSRQHIGYLLEPEVASH